MIIEIIAAVGVLYGAFTIGVWWSEQQDKPPGKTKKPERVSSDLKVIRVDDEKLIAPITEFEVVYLQARRIQKAKK